MTKVICGWCSESFNMKTSKGKHGYGTNKCPHCSRVVRSSRKELVEGVNAVKRFIHSDLKEGDVV